MNKSEKSDECLLLEYQKSDNLALLNEVFTRYTEQVWRIVFPMVLNHADADDLTQEVFLRAARAIHGFEHKAKFSTWLYRIAVNTTKNFLKSPKNKPFMALEYCEKNQSPHHEQPDRVAISGELDDRISVGLEQLSPPLRAAVVLTVMEDMDVSEAARVEHCATATMYWRVHQARKQLKSYLEVAE